MRYGSRAAETTVPKGHFDKLGVPSVTEFTEVTVPKYPIICGEKTSRTIVRRHGCIWVNKGVTSISIALKKKYFSVRLKKFSQRKKCTAK